MSVNGLSNLVSDPGNADIKEGVMLALLPIVTDWCVSECPHMTLVYVGTTKDLKPNIFNELAKDASMLASLSSPLTLRVLGVKQFGDTEKVDALDFQASPELLAMRRVVEKWNGSQFPFNPHATIGPPGSMPMNVMTPRTVVFDRLMVGWGDERLVFRLGQTRSY